MSITPIEFTLTHPQAIALARFAGIEFKTRTETGDFPCCEDGAYLDSYLMTAEGALKVLAQMSARLYTPKMNTKFAPGKWVIFPTHGDSDAWGDTAEEAILTAALTLEEVQALVKEEEEK